MAMVLTPFCQHSLHPSQKGFIPGRTGSDHIIAITDHFYGAIDSKQPLYELKIDTKKAFDSIDHTFIEAVIVAHYYSVHYKLRRSDYLCKPYCTIAYNLT